MEIVGIGLGMILEAQERLAEAARPPLPEPEDILEIRGALRDARTGVALVRAADRLERTLLDLLA